MPSRNRISALSLLAAVLVGLAPAAYAETLPAGITEEALANDNNLFLSLGRKNPSMGRAG